jgi:hypothetical protein
MRYYTTGILSARIATTPEGFLICHDVPIARTGVQLYADGEVPVPARDGLVRIQRLAEHVFAPQAMASYEGKAITLDHPSVDVNPDNWSQLAKGVIHNVRQGTGLDNEYLLADLHITERDAIRKVRDEGLREVSLGYDADYLTTGPGEGLQLNYTGNHLALVPRGRCGSRCAIGDSMKKIKFLDAVRAAFKSRDEAEHEKVLTAAVKDAFPDKDDEDESDEDKKKRLAKEKADDKEESKKTSDALASLSTAVGLIGTRLTAIEKKTQDADVEETEEEKTAREKKEKEDKAEKTADSASLAATVQDARSRAELLSPGIQLPTFDAALTPAKTQDALCQLKRKALAAAFENPKTRDAVSPLVKDVDLAALTCDALNAAFVGASEIVRVTNNATAGLAPTFDGSKQAANTSNSIAAMNARASAFWTRP